MRTLSRVLCGAALLTAFALPGFSSPIWDYSWVSANLFNPQIPTGYDYSTPQFTVDNAVFQAQFTVTGDQTVVVRSLGYGGGQNLAGLIIPAGGFAPAVQIFDSNGIGISSPLQGLIPPPCAPNSPSGPQNVCQDVYATFFLTAGTYTVALTQYGNVAVNDDLNQGFSFPISTGDPGTDAANASYAGGYIDYSNPENPVGHGGFQDAFGNPLNGSFALDIAISPEPGTMLLIGSGLILVGLGARKRRSSGRA